MSATILPHSHPILSCAEAKARESALLKDETAEWAAMQQAGTAVARAVLNDFKEIGGLPDNARLLVLVGKGHNGGDALLAAKAILEQYPQVTADIILCFGESSLRPLARRSLDALAKINHKGARSHQDQQLYVGANIPERAGELTERLKQNYDLCLDGIFGFQFRPPMDAVTAGLIAQVNAHPHITLRAAVDLPSGLGEDNAVPVFRADFTYATGIVKAPVIAAANAAHVGRLRYLDLGFFRVERVDPNSFSSAARILLPSILRPLAQLRPAQSDKRSYGHLFVVGGSRNYPGAVLLTVQAALRSGVGLLTAFVPESLVPEYAARFPEAMWVGFPEGPHGGLTEAGLPLIVEKLPRATALVIGPGLGAAPETIAAIRNLVPNRNKISGADVPNGNIPLVLDADALRPEVLEAAAGRPVICTPHAGELARIGEREALRPGQVLVCKGPLTCVTDGRTNSYSPYGGPVLARGGSGDILAGLIGGLLAQAPDDLWLAAARGTVWHGLAADLLARNQGQVAVQTTQLFDQLASVLRETL